MTADERVKSYLQGDAPTMQLATVQSGRPWVATVYFVADDDMNIYWLSWPERRHSQELIGQSDVAAAIVIKVDQPVIGIQLAGQAHEVTDETTVQQVMKLYVAKYNKGHKFYAAYTAGTNHHHMYKLTPSDISLFDELTYPDSSPVKL